MLLAVNDTDASRALLRSGRLEADAVETSGPKVGGFRAAFPDVPALLHVPVWDWSLARPDALTFRDAGRVIDEALAATGADWLSLHVGFSAAEVRYEAGMKPASAVLTRDATLAAMVRTVQGIRRRVRVPVLLENLDLQPGGAYEHVCDPTFLTELCDATGADLLLDLAHAQVSASRMGMAVDRYVDALPLERVRQVHLSGPRPGPDGTLHDAHDTVRPSDLSLLASILERCDPWAVTLEYGREKELLPHELRKVRVVIDATGPI